VDKEYSQEQAMEYNCTNTLWSILMKCRFGLAEMNKVNVVHRLTYSALE